MNKKELISKTNELLRANDIKKPVSIPKHIFHISDDDGNCRDFSVKKRDKTVIYTIDDVTNVIDACLAVIMDTLKEGEDITIHGFGTLGLSYRKPRKTRNVLDGKDIEIAGHYIPRFAYGKDLRMCAKTYELLVQDKFDAFNATNPATQAEGGE